MAQSPPGRPLSVLVLNLLVALAVAVGLFALFYVIGLEFHPAAGSIGLLVLGAGAIVLVTYLVARAVTAATNALLARHSGVTRGHAVRLFLNLLIMVGAVLALFKLAGVSLESIFLGSALAGIVLGLAAQTVLANVFAGLLLVVSDPFRPGDRISLVSSSYGAIWPSYPHEMLYPSYSGTVEDVGLIYTRLRLDSGSSAKIPNSVVIGALVVHTSAGTPRSQRVRMTFPSALPVASVETVVAALDPAWVSSPAGHPPPRIEVADIGPTTWDGVVVLWTTVGEENVVRDAVLRSVLAGLAAPPPKTGSDPRGRPTA